MPNPEISQQAREMLAAAYKAEHDDRYAKRDRDGNIIGRASDASWLQRADNSPASLRAIEAALALTRIPSDGYGRGESDSPAFFEKVAETVKEAGLDNAGFWHACSGCHETEDGHDVGHYPHSPSFNCKLGGGCSECGGVGAIWDTIDYDAMARERLADDLSAIRKLGGGE